MMTIEQREAIKELAIKYGINLKGNDKPNSIYAQFRLQNISKSKPPKSLEDIHIDRIDIVFYLLYEDEGLQINKSNLQSAEFILMLNKAIQNNTGIEMSITLKGIKENKVILSDSETLYNLWLLCNTKLEKEQCGLYQYEFGWKSKQNLTKKGYENLKRPYTKNELEKILLYERERKRGMKSYKKNARLKEQINIIRNEFREDGVFSNKTKELTSKEYQFLYDTLVVLSEFSEEGLNLSATEKKEALRDFVRERK